MTPDVLASLPPFSSIMFNSEASNGKIAGEKCKPEVAKTGLGSSAAMTTSVVAALLHYLGVVNLPFSAKSLPEGNTNNSDLDLVHVMAQSAHCIAQGKIGSGFDVSAAVYGSQRYVRFSPAVLSSAQVFSCCISSAYLILCVRCDGHFSYKNPWGLSFYLILGVLWLLF